MKLSYHMDREGFEPSLSACKAEVLPLSLAAHLTPRLYTPGVSVFRRGESIDGHVMSIDRLAC